jgi:hypothetical protein
MIEIVSTCTSVADPCSDNTIKQTLTDMLTNMTNYMSAQLPVSLSCFLANS